jgi:hypothetical protein
MVSGSHCRIVLREGRLWVEDLGSTNGTLIDERHVTEAPLGPDGSLRLGEDGPRLRVRSASSVRESGSATAYRPVPARLRAPDVEAPPEPPALPEFPLLPATTATVDLPPPSERTLDSVRSWPWSRFELPDLPELPLHVILPVLRATSRVIPLLIAAGLFYASSKLVHVGRRVSDVISTFQTEREIAAIRSQLAMSFRIDGELPGDFRVFLATHIDARGEKPPWMDFFGHEYSLEREMAVKDARQVTVGFAVRSAGPDGERGTRDDVVGRYHPIDWESVARGAPPDTAEAP